MIHHLALTLLITWLLLWVEHWFPWRLMLRRDLPRVIAYVLGVLAIQVPLSGLILYWRSCCAHIGAVEYVIAIWVITVGGGAAVYSAYGVDWLLDTLRQRQELSELLHGRDHAAGPSDE